MKRSAVFWLIYFAACTTAGAQWYVEGQAGRIRSSIEIPDIPSLTLANSNVFGGVRYRHPSAGLQLSAGLPTDRQDPIWGAVGGWKHLALTKLKILRGIDLAGNGLFLSERGTQPLAGTTGKAIVGQIAPVLAYENPRFSVRGRVGVSHYMRWLGFFRSDRTVEFAETRLSFSPAPSVALLPELRAYRAAEGAYVYAGASAAFTAGRASLTGAIGQWIGPGNDRGVPWSVGANFQVNSRLELNSTYRRTTVDVIYGGPNQASWSAGFAMRVAGNAPQVFERVPVVEANSGATIRLPAGDAASQPSIAGDFNGWKAEPMQRSGEYWIRTLNVTPGVYSFSFIDQKGEWFVPRNFPGRKEDGFGGHSAVLVVR